MAVAGGRAGFHRGVRAHAAVLFVELAGDFHDLTGCLAATGEQPAEDHGVGEREGFHDVAGLGDTAVGDEADAFLGCALAGDVECGELRNADTGDDAGGADGAGTLADFDRAGAALREILDAGGAGDIAGDDGEIFELAADHFDHVAYAGGVAVGGRDGDGVNGLFRECADVGENSFAVEFTGRRAHRGNRGPGDEAEMLVAGGLAAALGFVGDALDVGDGDEAAEVVFGVNHEHFVNADVLGEEFVRFLDRVGGEAFFEDGDELFAGRHHLGDQAGLVAFFNEIARQEADEPAFIDDGESAEIEPALFDQGEYVADEGVGCDGDGVLDQAVDVAFHPGEFLDLVFGGEIVVDEPETAVERHGDGHAGFGDGVHVGREDWNLQTQGVGERSGDIGVLRQNLAVEGRKRDVVVSQGDRQAGREKTSGGQIELGVGGNGLGHVAMNEVVPG